MLLGPQLGEQVGDPAVDRAQPVEARMAGAAEGDQRRGAVGGGAVVDDERRRGVTDAAGAVVAGEDPLPLAGEAVAVAPAAVVAGLAQAAAVEIPGSAGTAERELLLFEVGGHESAAGFLKRRPALRACGPDGERSPRTAPKFTIDK